MERGGSLEGKREEVEKKAENCVHPQRRNIVQIRRRERRRKGYRHLRGLFNRKQRNGKGNKEMGIMKTKRESESQSSEGGGFQFLGSNDRRRKNVRNGGFWVRQLRAHMSTSPNSQLHSSSLSCCCCRLPLSLQLVLLIVTHSILNP